MKEVIDFFNKTGTKTIGFNLLLNAKYKKFPKVSPYDANNFLLKAAEKAKNCGIYEDRIRRKIEAFKKEGKVYFKDCGAAGNQLVFFPNGNMGVCQAYLGTNEHIVGNISTSSPQEIVNSPILKKWAKRSPVNIEVCKYCPAIGICGGGCVFNAEITTGDMFDIDKSFCIHSNMVLDWLLKKSIKNTLKIKESVNLKDVSYRYVR